MKPLIRFILTLLLGASPFLQAAEVVLHPETQRFIDGVSTLDRRRHFNIAASSPGIWESCPLHDGAYLFDKLHVSLGRSIGLGSSIVKSGKGVAEDPARPGYVDRELLRRTLVPLTERGPELRQRLGDNLDVIVHEKEMPHPAFMGSSLADPSHYQRIASDPKAAADFIAQCLRYSYDDFTRPRYYEPLNEPSWPIATSATFAALHREVARAVKSEGLAVRVGGPCTAVGYLYYGGYEGQWKKMLKPFIDAVGREVDFVSFHIYDYYTGAQREILTGLPLENAFDLYEAYTFHTLGAVKPFACSEHGATGGNFNLVNRPELASEPGFKGVAVPRPTCEWLHLDAINGQLMSFLERPADSENRPLHSRSRGRVEPAVSLRALFPRGLHQDGCIPPHGDVSVLRTLEGGLRRTGRSTLR